MYIADLHIHSKYSRATSKSCVPEELDLWARRKGIALLGTGDFTHPVWRQELTESLVPAEEGLYRIRPELCQKDDTAGAPEPARFVLSGEISSIYKKNGKVRKVHNVILLPSLEAADTLAHRLEAVGNVHSDGRPILGLDSRDLLEITLEACPEAMFIPAHIWTPHFSVFGAFSGFDTLEECFEDLTPHIHALETGLSSDPPMNWRLSALDGYTLVSNSDAHSPAKLGREANLLDTELSYPALKRAIEGGKEAGFAGTVEFFPEEGKYHLDGHRKCNLCLTPEETIQFGGRCPVCGKKITIGVQHRVEELADRAEGYRPSNAPHFESLVPLPEVIAASTGLSPISKKVDAQYREALRKLGPEFYILREAPLEDIRRASGPLVEEGIRRLRAGEVQRTPGYDGEYGVIGLLDEAAIRTIGGQISFLAPEELADGQEEDNRIQELAAHAFLEETAAELSVEMDGEKEARVRFDGLNAAQLSAVTAPEKSVAVVAGPGTGKTKTLVSKIAYLIEKRGVKPSEITAVTFTNKAAGEMRERLEKRLGGKRAVRGLTVGTFHAICLQLLQQLVGDVFVLDEAAAQEIAAGVIRQQGLKLKPAGFLREVSVCRQTGERQTELLPGPAYLAYEQHLDAAGLTDLDGLLIKTLALWEQGHGKKAGKRFRYLLVDEFQDINDIQYQLVRAWSGTGDGLFVIGDPDQAIYGFRGANSYCFATLMADEPATRQIVLTENYRSTPQILHCALGVMEGDGKGKRQLAAHAPDGAAVHLLTAPSPLSEGIFVAKQINRLVGGVDMLDAHDMRFVLENRQPYGFSEIAVLYRTHKQAQLLESCLRKESIPYVVMGRDAFLNDRDVRAALCFFSYLVWPEEPYYLDTYTRLSGRVPESVSGLLEAYGPRVKKERPDKLLDDWMEETQTTGSESMQQLAYTAAFEKDMASMLLNLTFGQESDLMRGDKRAYAAGAVTLMTLHGAKGLEFPAVFLCGVKQGCIPLEMKGRKTDLEEERRLLYVGMTRAKEELYLLTSAEPSPFLADIPQGAVQIGQTMEREAPQGKQMSLFD